MIDRTTQVMSWLEGLTFDDWHMYHSDSEVQEIAKNAFDLLKENKPVKPKKIKGYHPPMYTLYQYKCENCESLMLTGQPFCCGCGRKVEWE